MSAPDEQAAAQREEERYARVMRRQFGVEVDDAAQTLSGSETGEMDEDDRFAACMRRHFPSGREG